MPREKDWQRLAQFPAPGNIVGDLFPLFCLVSFPQNLWGHRQHRNSEVGKALWPVSSSHGTQNNGQVLLFSSSGVWPAFGWDRGLRAEIWPPPGAHPRGEVCGVHPRTWPEWRGHLPAAWAGQPGEAAQRCVWCRGEALLWQVRCLHLALPSALTCVRGLFSSSWAMGLTQTLPRALTCNRKSLCFAHSLECGSLGHS